MHDTSPLDGATMIAADQELDGAPLLRTEFALATGHGDVVSAQLTSTALGVHEVTVNGRPVGPDVLGPGWSSYQWRLRWRTHDVTALLPADGAVAIGAALGNGWYRGRLGWTGGRALYGDELGLLARLDVTFADGHVQTVVTDETWRAGPSATTANDLYDGQTIDARRATPGWSSPGFDTSGWARVHALEFDAGRLAPPVGPPVVRHETVAPIEVFTSPSGRTLVDFGQNLVGWIRCTVAAPAGTEITVRHAEVLEHGELGTRPLRNVEATDRFITSGGADVFEPTMTFHGFRYAEVTGWPGGLTRADLDSGALEAVVVSSDLRRTGYFECSDELVNQLHRNVVWGLRGNFLDLPTDCPQRDERLGWTGDIAVFAPTAAYLYDVEDFLADWLQDLALEQRHQDGTVPRVVPDIFSVDPSKIAGDTEKDGAVTAVWGDAAVWVPWTLYEAYGHERVLADQYDSMTAHVDAIERHLSGTGLWDTGFQFADWLDPDAPPNEPGAAKADKGVVATACAYRSADLVARTARLLGRHDDARRFCALADRLKDAFTTHYVDERGTITSDCTTVYALAVCFGLVDGERRGHAGDRLAQLVEDAGHRVTTGFAGTPFVTWALGETGHLETAYRLLLETGCPSWLYPVTMGATTVWERWDSMLPDGTINPGTMTSFNHYALGAVADWLHKVVAGIAPTSPGYATVSVAPRPGGGLTWARARLDTPHGEVSSAWSIDGDRLTLDVVVPDGVTAEVALPGTDPTTVGGGAHQFVTDGTAVAA